MLKKWLSTWAVLCATLLPLATVTLGCSGDDDDDDDGTTTNPLDISITAYYTLSGDGDVLAGECVGLEITDANGGINDAVELFLVDTETEDEIGPFTTDTDGLLFRLDSETVVFSEFDPETFDYPCVRFPLDYPPATFDLRLERGSVSDTISDALTFTELDFEPVLVANTPVNGELTQMGAFDDFSYAVTGSGFGMVKMAFTSTAAIPFVQIYDDSFIDGYFGLDTVIVPAGVPGLQFFGSGRELDFKGADDGYNYTLTLDTNGTPAVNNGDDACQNSPATTFSTSTPPTTFVFTADLTGKADNYDPDEGTSCQDWHFFETGEPGTVGPGPDVTYKVTLTAGQKLTVSAAGNDADAVLYLTGNGTTGTSCAATPTCTKAADIFGPIDTDTLVYKNTSGSTESHYLVLDSFTDEDTGTVTVWLTIE